jgi:hypothetical protein
VPAIGVLTLELHLTEARSLKDKRHYVKSVKDRLRSRFNVAVAETEDQSLWNRSTITVVTVSASREYAAGLLAAAENDAASVLGPFLTSASVDWIE